MQRRALLVSAGWLGATGLMGPVVAAAGGANGYPRTRESLDGARVAELAAYHRYVLFSGRAADDAYPGISYLFAALASSEIIHAQNYERVLVAMGTYPTERPEPNVPVSDTRANLIYAVEREVDTIDNRYPRLLRIVESEGYAEAVRNVHYAWESHKQHRDMIDKIRRYSPAFFETVARRLDEMTQQIFICQICGSTVKRMPDTNCPICTEPSTHYRPLDPAMFQS